VEAPVQVASVQTLARRAEVPPADLIVTDECHRATAASYRAVTDRYPDSRLLGLTATPYRFDGTGLGEIYDVMEEASTIPRLISEGFLVPPEVWGTSSTPDMAGVRKQAGDFHRKEAAETFDKPHLVGDVVRTWADRALDRITVLFAASVEHSGHLVDAFCQVGVSAAHLEAGTPADERRQILDDLAAERVQIVSNVGLLTEGWDLPACGCVVMARPTMSKSLYMQMAGRGLRSAKGKTDCLILDHAGNTGRHGFVTDPQTFTLAGQPETQAQPARMCPQCFAYQESAKPVCDRCGYAWPVATGTGEKQELEHRDGELVQLLSSEVAKGSAVDLAGKTRAMAKLRDQARATGKPPTWANGRFREIYGHWPDAAMATVGMGEGAPR
jgi:superfamily II DNA or RNA helicase